MGNHYHLILQPSESGISAGLRQLNGVYGQSFNRRHRRVGHVFAGRFKSLLVDRDNYLLQVARYLALNPVRAGLASIAEDWSWSHHRAMAGIDPARSFLTRDEILGLFDSRSRTAAQGDYRRFVDSNHSDEEIVGNAIERGGILGAQEFVERVRPALDEFVTEAEIPWRERLSDRPELAHILKAPVDRNLRTQLIRTAHERYRYTVVQIARHLGVSRSTIGRALAQSAFPADPTK